MTYHSVAAAEQSNVPVLQLAGSWLLVSVDNILTDGSRIHLYGPTPEGFLTFDDKGRYSLQIYRTPRSLFAESDKAKATAEENSAAVQGSNAHYGNYTIDETSHTVTFHIEHASFPNWDGTEQKRPYSISGDHLKYTVPTPTSGGTATGEVEWKRAK